MADGRDRRFVDACLRGDREAYDELVKVHAARVYAVCLAIVGASADAEDLAQEALVTWYMKLASLADELPAHPV
jgi:DNA-directed RNA polymerase specialized sigma24 family protein